MCKSLIARSAFYFLPRRDPLRSMCVCVLWHHFCQTYTEQLGGDRAVVQWCFERKSQKFHENHCLQAGPHVWQYCFLFPEQGDEHRRNRNFTIAAWSSYALYKQYNACLTCEPVHVLAETVGRNGGKRCSLNIFKSATKRLYNGYTTAIQRLCNGYTTKELSAIDKLATYW